MDDYSNEVMFTITCICASVFLSIISFNYALDSSGPEQQLFRTVAQHSCQYHNG